MAESPNGFRIKNWSDVLAVLGIVAMLAGAIAWGLKLDSGFTSHEGRISALENETGARPDPFTGTEGRALEARIRELERKLESGNAR